MRWAIHPDVFLRPFAAAILCRAAPPRLRCARGASHDLGFLMAKGVALITGGAGFIGSHIADLLIGNGYRVRALDVLEPQVHGDLAKRGGRPDYLHPDVELMVGDVADPAAVDAALRGVDCVFHKAALVGVGQSMYDIVRYSRANDLGCATLLDAIANKHRKTVKKIVVASSMSIYGEGAYADATTGERVPNVRLRSKEQMEAGEWEMLHPNGSGQRLRPAPTPESKPLDPRSIYAAQKRSHEESVLAVGAAYNIPAVALRYFNVYGSRQALSNPYTGVAAIFCSRLLNGKAPVIFEDGGQTRDFVHVGDIARANLLALERSDADGEAVNVGSGRPIAIRDLALLLRDHLYPNAPADQRERLAPKTTGEYRAGDIRHCAADISKARRLLGYAPATAMEDGVGELVAWIRRCHERPADKTEQAHAELAERGLTK
jgi:dTDP-L-rhamnose 4-epimerase